MNSSTRLFISIIVSYLTLLIAVECYSRVSKWVLYKMFCRKYGIKVKKSDMNIKKACKNLGISVSKFKKMSKSDLKSLYREKVKEVHPDMGGAQEDFINLQEAYEFAQAA